MKGEPVDERRRARPSLLRRIIGGIADTIAIAGMARLGSGPTRGNNLVQTRFIADSALQAISEHEDQSEQARARWSLAGALALALLGGLTVAGSMAAASTVLFVLGLAQILAAGGAALVTARRQTQGSVVHLVGVGLAVISIYASLPAFMSAGSIAVTVAGLILAIGAILGLVVGRR
jgi:hypothetical protein